VGETKGSQVLGAVQGEKQTLASLPGFDK
jgi:hypothetical protein